jgi:hypothetical protein
MFGNVGKIAAHLVRCKNYAELAKLQKEWAAKGFDLYMHSTKHREVLESGKLFTGDQIDDKYRTNPTCGSFVWGYKVSKVWHRSHPYGEWWAYYVIPKGVISETFNDATVRAHDNCDIVGFSCKAEFEEDDPNNKKK